LWRKIHCLLEYSRLFYSWHENLKIHWLFYKHVLNLLLHYINQNYLYNLENYEFIKSCVFFTSHEYVVGFTTFFWCVSLIELNAWKDDWLLSIGDLQEGKKNKKSDQKRKRFKEVINLWLSHEYLQIGCKFKWEKH
jgi:hypothetical protein